METTEQVIVKTHPHYIGFFRFYFSSIVFVLGGICFIVFWPKNAIIGIIIIIIGFFVFLIGETSRRAETFYVLDNGVAREYKFMSTSRTYVEYEKIQNVNVNQSIWQSIFKIGTIGFDTSGTDKVEVVFAGIKDPLGIEKIVREKMKAN